MARLVLGVSGASGIVLAYRALRWLTSTGHTVDLIISKAAYHTATIEMGPEWAREERFLRDLTPDERSRVNLYKNQDMAAPIASGSYPGDGMLLMPCSMATLAAVAIGLSDNLIRRAADVALKERRTLVIVPRECPLSEIHLENMLRLAKMGAVIVPPVPAWYVGHKLIEEVEEFIVARALDFFKIEGPQVRRWGL